MRCRGLEVLLQLPFHAAAAELACQHHPWEQVPRQRSRSPMGPQIVQTPIAPRVPAKRSWPYLPNLGFDSGHSPGCDPTSRRHHSVCCSPPIAWLGPCRSILALGPSGAPTQRNAQIGGAVVPVSARGIAPVHAAPLAGPIHHPGMPGQSQFATNNFSAIPWEVVPCLPTSELHRSLFQFRFQPVVPYANAAV